MLHIGLDCDGVLRGFSEQVLHLCKTQGAFFDYPTEWNWLNTTSVEGRLLKDWIWTDKIWTEQVFEQAPLIAGAYESYKLLCELEDTRVSIISHQVEGTEHYTDKWLDSFGFNIHDQTIYTEDKYNMDIDIMIDDNPKHISRCTDRGIAGLLIDHPYNESYNYLLRFKNLQQASKWIIDKHV